MVHLLPLPGAPGQRYSITEVISTAVQDARLLADAGFPALMIENYGDAPFFPDEVPPETIASMSVAVQAVAEATGLPTGVNVLRNDGLGALAVAAATGASLIRVNVLTGVMYTDQGVITGRAAEILRRRAVLCPSVEIWADVMVKHATPPPGTDPARLALDTLNRGGADALIVSGPGTGVRPDQAMMASISEAIPAGTRLVVGSGATPGNLDALCEVANTVIVGSAIKIGGEAANRVDPQRALDFVQRARSHGLLI